MNTPKVHFYILFFVTLFLLIWTVSVLNSNENGYTWQDFAIFGAFGVCALILAFRFLLVKWNSATETQAQQGANQNDKNTENAIRDLGKKFSLDLFRWQHEINSPRIKESLAKLIGLFGTIIKMEDEVATEKYYGRYSENINNLLSKYNKLEEAKLDSDDAKQTMTNLEDSLEQTVVALRNEINTTYKYDLQTINAESKAFLQTLRNRGLLD